MTNEMFIGGLAVLVLVVVVVTVMTAVGKPGGKEDTPGRSPRPKGSRRSPQA